MNAFIWGEYDRQMPLLIKYETKPLWGDLRDMLGVSPAGAAIAVHAVLAAENGCPETSYSRCPGWYAKRGSHSMLTHWHVTQAIDALAAAPWIEHFKQVPGGRGRQSHFRPLPALTQAVKGLIGNAVLSLIEPQRPIILRDKDGLPLPLPDTRDVYRMDRELTGLNDVLRSVDVRNETGACLSSPVVRIFNRNMDRGGRFYAMGANWQNIPKAERGGVLIDGQETVELDYSALHPSILYARKGLEVPADCYASDTWPRALMKNAVLVIVNADGYNAARLALANKDEVRAWAKDHEKSPHAVASALLSEAKQVNPGIASEFFTGAGAGLMRIDSQIAACVLKDLNKQGIPALPVHDSFLVPASKEGQLADAMVSAAMKHGLKSPRIGRKERVTGKNQPPTTSICVRSEVLVPVM